MTSKHPTHKEDSAIDIRSLRVDYENFNAVNDISLVVPKGEIFGLVGPNGAGKTSTFKVLATLIEPTYGDISLCGVDILEDLQTARRIIGYMPDLAPVPSDLKVWEFLDFYADAYSECESKSKRMSLIEECMDEVDMTANRNSMCKSLSRGQTQRVVLAKTLLPRPKILILDEPASGLDSLSRRNLKRTLRRVADKGTTIMISSHILSELAEMCTSLCIMNLGQILAQGTAEEIQRELGSCERLLHVRVLDDLGKALAWLKTQNCVLNVKSENDVMHFNFEGNDEQQAKLISDMVNAGFAIRTVEEKHSSFEEILTQIAEGNHG